MPGARSKHGHPGRHVRRYRHRWPNKKVRSHFSENGRRFQKGLRGTYAAICGVASPADHVGGGTGAGSRGSTAADACLTFGAPSFPVSRSGLRLSVPGGDRPRPGTSASRGPRCVTHPFERRTRSASVSTLTSPIRSNVRRAESEKYSGPKAADLGSCVRQLSASGRLDHGLWLDRPIQGIDSR